MQSIVVTVHISLELYGELVEYRRVRSVCIPSNEIPAFLTPAVPFLSWFSAAVLTNNFIPKLGFRKSKCEGANLCLEPQAKSSMLLSWPRSSMRGRVIISIMLCFLFVSRCPAHGLCLAAAELWERQIWPLLAAFSPFSEGRRAVRILPCPQVSRAAIDVESTPEWLEMFIYSHFIL